MNRTSLPLIEILTTLVVLFACIIAVVPGADVAVLDFFDSCFVDRVAEKNELESNWSNSFGQPKLQIAPLVQENVQSPDSQSPVVGPPERVASRLVEPLTTNTQELLLPEQRLPRLELNAFGNTETVELEIQSEFLDEPNSLEFSEKEFPDEPAIAPPVPDEAIDHGNAPACESDFEFIEMPMQSFHRIAETTAATFVRNKFYLGSNSDDEELSAISNDPRRIDNLHVDDQDSILDSVGQGETVEPSNPMAKTSDVDQWQIRELPTFYDGFAPVDRQPMTAPSMIRNDNHFIPLH